MILAVRGSSGASSRVPDPPCRPREDRSTHPGATTSVTLAHEVAVPKLPPARRIRHATSRERRSTNSYTTTGVTPAFGVAIPELPPVLRSRITSPLKRMQHSFRRHDRRDSCTRHSGSEVALGASNLACTFPKESAARFRIESQPHRPEGQPSPFEHQDWCIPALGVAASKLPPKRGTRASPPKRRLVSGSTTTGVIPAVGLAVLKFPPGR